MVGDWTEVARELPVRVRAWMDRLSAEGVRGADLVFACIGPAMEIYSRYAKVVDAEDREIPLGGDPTSNEPHTMGYLAKVWEVVGRLALERVLRADGGHATLEEDARLTALFLWSLESTGADNGEVTGAVASESDEFAIEAETGEDDGAKAPKMKGFTLPFDIVRRFAQPLGIRLEDWEGRIVETDKGVVRLLPIAERTSRLFGKEDTETVAKAIREHREKFFQTTLFPQERLGVAPELKPEAAPAKRNGKSKAPAVARKATTLDRLHAAMLLQRAGQSAALRIMLEEETRRGPEFEHLANALSALYPTNSEEKRLINAMLLSMPRR